MKNKIDFFNSIMSVHDPANNYDEKLADFIFCNFHEFDIYYEVYKELYQLNIITKPIKFIFVEGSNCEINKYSLKIGKDSIGDIEKIYSILKNDKKIIETAYSTANVSYGKNSKGTIFITIKNIKLHTDVSKRSHKGKEKLSVES